jgi:glycosyltransferase involved in cell wall biosynthesis
MFAPFGERVIFLGQVDEVALIEQYAMADLLVWPSINKAYWMALLEAQAAGLPVVAGRRPGVADIVRERERERERDRVIGARR